MASAFSFDSLNHAQREAVGALDGPVLILAGAAATDPKTLHGDASRGIGPTDYKSLQGVESKAMKQGK